MGNSPYVNSVEGATDQYQRTVDAFFQRRSSYWRDVYRADTLSAFIYRERRSAVLSMIDKLRIPICSRVLDVGCGAGSITIPLAQRGYRVSAVDTVEGMLDLLRHDANQAGLNANVKTNPADICQLSFPSRAFAMAVAVGVFAWLEHPRQALMELYRVTRPGGYVILTAANKWSLNQVLDPLCFPGLRLLRGQIAEVLEKFNVWNRSRPRQHRYSANEIDALLSQAGFRKLEGRTLGFGPFTMFKQRLLPTPAGVKVHQKLQALAGRRFPVIRSCGAVYVVLSQKP